MIRRLAWLICICGLGTALVVGMTGCGSGAAVTPLAVTSTPAVIPSAPLTSIAINPSTATLAVGQVYQFTATGTDTDGKNGDVTDSVTWSTSDPAVLSVGPAGVAVANAPGAATVTAASPVDASKSATATVVATYTGMLVYHNDLARTGQNLNETILLPAIVNSAQFGKLFSYPVDGGMYAQPLYVRSVTVGNQGVHNVVYVATEHDSVYAFDADGNVGAPLWHVSFINPSVGITTVPPMPGDDSFPGGEIGITSTPAIDPATGTLYVVSCTLENGRPIYRLHALDLGTGAEKLGGPVAIVAFTPGIGDDSDGRYVYFDPAWHLQRPALLLLSGVVYIGFGSHDDLPPYHGWLLAYDAKTLKQTAVYNATPNAALGAIWQAGCGPSVDADGNLYVATANGTFDASADGPDYGDSVVKLDPASLKVLDWFTPFNQAFLNTTDDDLGSGGAMLLPDQPGLHPHLLVLAGKEGRIYLLDRDQLGHYGLVSDPAVQELIGAINPNNLSTPAYWQGNVYYASENDHLKMFRLNNGLLSTSPVTVSQASFGYAGATPSISANGSTGGIVWVIDTSAVSNGGPAQLRAYDATDVSHELYDSTQAGSRDTPGTANKFAVPTVINGKAYVGTATELDVFGPF